MPAIGLRPSSSFLFANFLFFSLFFIWLLVTIPIWNPGPRVRRLTRWLQHHSMMTCPTSCHRPRHAMPCEGTSGQVTDRSFGAPLPGSPDFFSILILPFFNLPARTIFLDRLNRLPCARFACLLVRPGLAGRSVRLPFPSGERTIGGGGGGLPPTRPIADPRLTILTGKDDARGNLPYLPGPICHTSTTHVDARAWLS